MNAVITICVSLHASEPCRNWVYPLGRLIRSVLKTSLKAKDWFNQQLCISKYGISAYQSFISVRLHFQFEPLLCRCPPHPSSSCCTGPINSQTACQRHQRSQCRSSAGSRGSTGLVETVTIFSAPRISWAGFSVASVEVTLFFFFSVRPICRVKWPS